MNFDEEGRIVAHIDLDAFFVNAELLRRPELRGKPVIIAGNGPRAVVSTASYEARRYGVGSGIPAARARGLCPEGIFLDVDISYYRAVSAKVMKLVAGLGAPIERASVDEVYLELGGLADPVAAMRELVTRISAELDLDASVGIGPNKLVAKVASDAEKPRGFLVIDRLTACERFALESPRLLPGIGPKTTERLASLGIETITRLQTFPEAVLIDRFGPTNGSYLHRRGHFLDDDPVAERERKSISVEETFDRDLRGRAAMEAVLERQSQRLAALMRKQRTSGRTITIRVRLDDFTTVTRSRTLTAPTADPKRLAGVAKELLAAYAPPRPVRLLGVRVASLTDVDAAPAAPVPPASRAAAARRSEPAQLELDGSGAS